MKKVDQGVHDHVLGAGFAHKDTKVATGNNGFIMQEMSIKSAIELYRYLLTNGRIRPYGPAHERMMTLQSRYDRGERLFKNKIKKRRRRNNG